MSDIEKSENEVLDQAEKFGLSLNCKRLYSITLGNGSTIGDLVNKCFDTGVDSISLYVRSVLIKFKDGTSEDISLPGIYDNALEILFQLVHKGFEPNECVLYKYGEDREIDDPSNRSALFYVVYKNSIVVESINYLYNELVDKSLADQVFYYKDGKDEIWVHEQNLERTLKKFWDAKFENTETFKKYKIANPAEEKSQQNHLILKLDGISEQLKGIKNNLGNFQDDRLQEIRKMYSDLQSKSNTSIFRVLVLILIIQIIFLIKYIL